MIYEESYKFTNRQNLAKAEKSVDTIHVLKR